MKYMFIHTIDPNTQHGTDDRPDFDSWLQEVLARGVTLHGDRLQDVSDATTVQVRNREVLVSDGPFAETKEQIAGYDVIECADLDEAIEIPRKRPPAWLGSIEARPIQRDRCDRPAEAG